MGLLEADFNDMHWPLQLAALAGDSMLKQWIDPKKVRDFVQSEAEMLPDDQRQCFEAHRAPTIQAITAYVRRWPGAPTSNIISMLVGSEQCASPAAVRQGIFRAHRAGILRREGDRSAYRYYVNV